MLNIYALPLGTIIAICTLTIVVWTIISLFVQRYKNVWLVLNVIFAVLSFLAILYYTIIDRTGDTTQSIPFVRTIEHIRQRPELVREMVMNAFLFFPFGLTAPFAISGLSCMDNKKSSFVLITILIALILTCTIELIQYLSNFGNCEFSDIVMNTLGAAIGSVSYLMSSKLIR